MIPAWSARLILLRQRLSLTFFFQDPRYLTKSADYTIDINLITRRLQVSQFTITNATDFSDLAASISILSIGIDRIDRPSSPCSKDAELAFNRDVDSLTSKINSMFNNIVDTGASHMKRTEAKEVLECFQRRLEYAVRTKPKPKKKMVFGEDEVVPLQEKMKAFLNDRRSTDLLATANGL